METKMSNMISTLIKECENHMGTIDGSSQLPPTPDKQVLPQGRKCNFSPTVIPEIKLVIQEPKEDILLYFAYLAMAIGFVLLGRAI